MSRNSDTNRTASETAPLREGGGTGPSELSGWILPDGTWHGVEEWWHVSCLYDLRDSGIVPALKDPLHSAALERGDESEIRDMAAKLGFVKISRGEIDAYALSDAQLRTLQASLEEFDPEFEFRLLIAGGQQVQLVSVERILKLRSARALFPEQT